MKYTEINKKFIKLLKNERWHALSNYQMMKLVSLGLGALMDSVMADDAENISKITPILYTNLIWYKYNDSNYSFNSIVNETVAEVNSKAESIKKMSKRKFLENIISAMSSIGVSDLTLRDMKTLTRIIYMCAIYYDVDFEECAVEAYRGFKSGVDEARLSRCQC